ncbi:MAG TPA: carbamoyltransferase HypF [Kofleriaceae bacterium]
MSERVQITISGIVQGVGFRPFVCGLAGELGLGGFVTNRAGDVVIEAEGAHGDLARFVTALRDRRPPSSRVDRIVTAALAACGDHTFSIAPSDAGDAAAAAIAPDLATCDACRAEIFEPSERRAGYAFTSCASCGPRLTIVTAAPYDRDRTTMASFAMCNACRAEYDDPRDRRFHAQPIACPACGPQLVLEPPGDGDPIAATAAALANGEIIAIKGLGGYHLACDATNEPAIAELRRRKQRDAKPFAIMVADRDAAHALVELDPVGEGLLASSARPIVLARRRPDVRIADAVAPDVGELGVMLPYTPLHELLLREVGRPLVMTSGNVTDEPIAFDDRDARDRLGTIADRFLVHDRPIHMRCEDSVARVVDGAPMILRRARGFAPAPVRLPVMLARPTLALGGHLKAVFALGIGDTAYLSPHLGDLDHLSAYDGYLVALEHFQALHRVRPERIVHDRHPDYATTRLAERLGCERLAVQHHHAHFASALAEAELGAPAIGVIFDGAGFGDDGTIWGGEIFIGDLATAHRALHLSPVALPGGDRAALEPWRMAIAHLLAARESIAPVVARIGKPAIAVEALCRVAPMTSSAGRLFDAVAGILDLCEHQSYEGQAAMRLERLAGESRDPTSYPVELAGMVLDTTGIIRGVVSDAAAGVKAPVIARRFHTSVIELVALGCARLADREGLEHVVLSGGVFQNAILANELPHRLRADGLVTHLQRRVPTNDGGLAFGQLAIAGARDAVERRA